MNTHVLSNFKRMAIRVLIILLVVALLLPACHSEPKRYQVEEITFQSAEFTLVGDLLLPEGSGPFPVILFLEGSGPVDRYGWMSLPELVLQVGYATFIWDAPGLGESTGYYDDARIIDQRTRILLAAIDAVRERPEINPQRIGLLGQSQGGWVISRALTETDEVAFVICIACPGMSGRDEMAYQITRMAFCDDPAAEADPQVAALLAELRFAAQYETYEEYLHYWEVLDELAELAPDDFQDRSPVAKETWEANPLEPVTTWDPVRGIARTGIPILSIFGDRDRNLNPYRGDYAWEQALAQGGNPQSRLAIIPGVDHNMFPSQTGCPAEMGQILEQYSQSKGYDSFDELYLAYREDPYRPGAFADFPWAPEVLKLVDEWLRELKP
jgi:pimeloyl-ACP methyl ester carboxylesterase